MNGTEHPCPMPQSWAMARSIAPRDAVCSEDDEDGSERRQHTRLPLEIEIELHCPGRPVGVVRTDNLSDGGLLLIAETSECPPIGAQVRIRVAGILGDGECPPMVHARVVRHVANGFAVIFEET